MPILSIHNACKAFQGLPVLANVNIEIATNSVVGLAGPSGSGKSTLLRAIQKLETLDQGNIDFKEKSGFMFQDFQLFPHFSVLKNLTYAPLRLLKDKDVEKRARTLLSALGIEDKSNCFPAQLSGGQKQRVALARSLMMQPKLLLCDEPTSGLDVATIDEVIALLNSIRAMGVTMLIASHDLDFLTRFTDRIIILKNGCIAADVEPKSLNNPLAYLKKYY